MLCRLNGLAWLASTALSLSWSLGAHAAGNPVDGEKKFYTCYGCHGIDNYRNAYPDYSVPKLRHQHASYIVAALHEPDGQFLLHAEEPLGGSTGARCLARDPSLGHVPRDDDVGAQELTPGSGESS